MFLKDNNFDLFDKQKQRLYDINKLVLIAVWVFGVVVSGSGFIQNPIIPAVILATVPVVNFIVACWLKFSMVRVIGFMAGMTMATIASFGSGFIMAVNPETIGGLMLGLLIMMGLAILATICAVIANRILGKD
jgi:hypothetical protein